MCVCLGGVMLSNDTMAPLVTMWLIDDSQPGKPEQPIPDWLSLYQVVK